MTSEKFSHDKDLALLSVLSSKFEGIVKFSSDLLWLLISMPLFSDKLNECSVLNISALGFLGLWVILEL